MIATFSNARTMLATGIAAAGMLLTGCTGDSLQPTASKNANATQPPLDRPLTDFTMMQGKYCLDVDGTGNCQQFLKPTANFVVAYDLENDRTMAIDYAGIVADHLVQNGGDPLMLTPQRSGKITETVMDDGRAQVFVHMNVSNAIAWMVDGNRIYEGEPLFGFSTSELQGTPGVNASRGTAILELVYTAPAPGMPIPDLVQLIHSPADFKITRLNLMYDGSGTLRGKAWSDDMRGNISVRSIGKWTRATPATARMSPPTILTDIDVQ